MVITECLNAINTGAYQAISHQLILSDIRFRDEPEQLHHQMHGSDPPYPQGRKLHRDVTGFAIRAKIPEEIHQRIIAAAATTGPVALQPFIQIIT